MYRWITIAALALAVQGCAVGAAAISVGAAAVSTTAAVGSLAVKGVTSVGELILDSSTTMVSKAVGGRRAGTS